MKTLLCFLFISATALMPLSAASRKSDQIYFLDSTETEADVIDVRPANNHRNRNHRGRGKGHIQVPEFEQGIPDVYPVRGPPQLPIVLATAATSTSTLKPAQQFSTTNTEKPIVSSTPNLIYITAKSTTNSDQYANNPFLKSLQTSTKNVPAAKGSLTNQLPNTDKPLTTTPSYQNPRLTDLLYGSNLLVDEQETNRDGKAEKADDIEFGERGLFDTAPHCQKGQILVNNRCRLQV